MLAAVLALHAAQAAAAPVAVKRWGPRGFALLAAAPLAALTLLLLSAGNIVDGEPLTEHIGWVDDLGVAFDLRADSLSLAFTVLITGIGALVFFYAASYFAPQAGLVRLATTLALFAGSMVGLVVADNLFVLYVFWELTSLTSFFLIGWEHHKTKARAAAQQALLVTVAGGLAMLAGFVLLAQEAGTPRISSLVADPPGGTATAVGLALVLVGALTKSAQVPFHFWLPSAMEAPTPISAYLHSATMVKAGIYLVARLAPVGETVGFWAPTIVSAGLVTMLVGGYLALRQHDLKLLLAYGTISQLGFMMLLVGGGFGDAAFAGAAIILAHGLFKAALFLVVGIVDHAAHTRDLRELPRLASRMPAVFAVAVVAAASMAGIPLLFGFVAKEAAIHAWLVAPSDLGDTVVLAGVIIGSALTAAYSARFVWGAFLSDPVAGEGHREVERPSAAFVAAPVMLGVATVVLGLAPGVVEPLVLATAELLHPGDEVGHLAVWPGVSTGLALSALALAGGAVLFVLRRPVEALQQRLAVLPPASRSFDGLVASVNRWATRVTGVVQSGSLPVYLGAILLTAVLVPGVPLLTAVTIPDDSTFAYSWLQVLAAALVIGSITAAAIVRHRFAAALLLGATGYSVAALFAIQGAPDLALTQVLVETVAVVMFVLVLRHLPPRFRTGRVGVTHAGRALVAVSVGAFMATFAIVAAGARQAPPISEEYVERAATEAESQNIVNAILVDFRAFDTLGEITVLTVAALGIVSLVRAGRKPTE